MKCHHSEEFITPQHQLCFLPPFLLVDLKGRVTHKEAVIKRPFFCWFIPQTTVMFILGLEELRILKVQRGPPKYLCQLLLLSQYIIRVLDTTFSGFIFLHWMIIHADKSSLASFSLIWVHFSPPITCLISLDRTALQC